MIRDWSNIQVRVKPEKSGRWRYRPGMSVDPMMYPFVEDNDLWYYWAGRGWVQCQAGSVEVGPGSCLWVRPGWKYDVRQDPEAPLGMAFIHFDLLDQHGQRISPTKDNLPPDVLTVGDSNLTEAIVRRIVDICHALNIQARVGPYEKHAADSLLKGLLIDLDQSTTLRANGEAMSRYHRIVSELTQYIEHHLNQRLSVADLAQHAHYSRNRLTRIFKDVTGLTPQEYIISARVSHARRLLRTTEMSVTEIAGQLGYENVYYFSRQFKQQTQKSPREFRKLWKKPEAS